MLEDNIRAVTQFVMIMSQPWEGNNPFAKEPSKSKEGQNRDRKRSNDQSQKKREPPQFTLLNVSYERLLLIICDLSVFKWPVVIQTNLSKETYPYGATIIEIVDRPKRIHI